ncbi:hypothetical protein, partial [Salmonella enterica]|uniref:hypothetical protein n=1 Tax=Salmonella enterica TaxID=28901 RepID=UPI001F3B33BB
IYTDDNPKPEEPEKELRQLGYSWRRYELKYRRFTKADRPPEGGERVILTISATNRQRRIKLSGRSLVRLQRETEDRSPVLSTLSKIRM